MIGAQAAADVAGVTYRQLDYWTRKGWVRCRRTSTRRLYEVGAVVRMAALGHFAASGVRLTDVGPRLAATDLPTHLCYSLVLNASRRVWVLRDDELRAYLAAPGRYVVFDPRATILSFFASEVVG